MVYECYLIIKDGTYTLKLGGGLFGYQTGYPHSDAGWEGCGRSGGARDQFTFQIIGGQCIPLVVQSRNRCFENTQMPSLSPSAAPTAPTINVNGIATHGRRLDEKDGNNNNNNNNNLADQKVEEIVDPDPDKLFFA